MSRSIIVLPEFEPEELPGRNEPGGRSSMVPDMLVLVHGAAGLEAIVPAYGDGRAAAAKKASVAGRGLVVTASADRRVREVELDRPVAGTPAGLRELIADLRDLAGRHDVTGTAFGMEMIALALERRLDDAVAALGGMPESGK